MENESLQLRGRVALVTGGSRGIGRAVAERLSDQGVHVVVNYRSDKDSAEAVVDYAIAKGVSALALQADVSNLSEAISLIGGTLQQFQRLDFLICNAGVWEGAPVDEIPEAMWDKTMNVNLRGTWTMCHAAVPI